MKLTKEIEQKAKAYDEALEKARQLCAYPTIKPFISDLQDLFPELKESEDERIRKALIELVHDTTGDSLWVDYNVHKEWVKAVPNEIECFLNELEKQGEQNLANSAKTCKVEQNHNNCVDYKDAIMHVVRHYVIPDEIDDELRRIAKGEWKYATWSEEDKAVLDALIRRLEGKDVYVSPHLAIECLKFLKDRVQPQPKQDWSEEDEVGFNDALWAIEQAKTIAKDENDMGNLWYAERLLNSFKERCTWKPSDEQLFDLKGIAKQNEHNMLGKSLMSLYNDLLKLKG